MILSVSIIGIFVVVFFLTSKYFKKFRVEYSDSIAFVTTVFATFIGVFVAIEASNINETKLEKEKTLSLLNIAGYELGQIIHEANISIGVMQADSNLNNSRFIEDNPLPEPAMFEILFSDEIFLRNLTHPTLQSLSRSYKNLQKMYSIMSPDDNARRPEPSYFPILTVSQHIQKIIAAEIGYIEGEYDIDDIEQLNVEFMHELIDQNVSMTKILRADN